MARRNGITLRFAAALLAPLAGTGAGADSALPTVYSLNLCTDQLAMLLAAPGQLQSVSELATDPSLSVLHEQARQYPANRGLAEDVVAASPDLVVTGAWSARNATDLLRGLGYRVETFAPDLTLDGIRADIARMGKLMQREQQADGLLADFDAQLAKAPDAACPASFRPSLLVYGPNGVTEGAGTLPDTVIEAAGFRNLGAGPGTGGMAFVSLENVIAMQPDVILLPAADPAAPALAQKLFNHPALKASGARIVRGAVDPALWTCGGPFTARAVTGLKQLRASLPGCERPGS
ncbi:MAG: ABC transporter substrate-binding protein [Zhengella sp.]|uniref:ABC transporter substrate-binding protein n=1 Tax=Zhengella sp. TaxID=2282762 RepID=UPI001E12D256|nr:ABC transporter substrate-binding protein [Notoacmeibacter sp.]MCC0028172.1 ABC transporter substrate-binding protein [Brucellaceae bacterium]